MGIINRLKEKWMAPAAAVGGVLIILIGLNVIREPAMTDLEVVQAIKKTSDPECVVTWMNGYWRPTVRNYNNPRVTQSVVDEGEQYCEENELNFERSANFKKFLEE